VTVLARFERSVPGRVIISLGVVVVIVCIVVVNMPPSLLRRDAGRYTLPVTFATGLNQDWTIFSQPRTIAAYVDARIDFADGSSTVKSIFTGHWLNAYVDYRWQKYEEVIRPASGSPFWRDYAEYVAAHARRPGHEPVRVTLIRRFAQTLPPGPGPAHGPWNEVTMYVLNLDQPG
jgi:hypothetical protein